MATVIELGIIVPEGGFPSVTVEDREDARELVRLLQKAGVSVNLREIARPLTPQEQKILNFGVNGGRPLPEAPPGPGEAGFDYETFAAHTREKYQLSPDDHGVPGGVTYTNDGDTR